MSESQPISARRLEQLKSMVEARQEMGQATTLERAVPELVAEISSLHEQSAKMSHKIAAVIEDLHNIAAQASGEDDAVTRMAARARQRLRGELGPGQQRAPDAAQGYEDLLHRAETAADEASRKTYMVRDGSYVYDMEQHRFLHLAPDGAERTMFRAFEFYFDEQNVSLWAFNDAPRMGELIGELAAELRCTRQQLERIEAEKRVAVELINAEGLTGEHVHRLDSEGLMEQQVHDADSASPETGWRTYPDAVLHLHPLTIEHGDAMISGNREGLRILKDRLQQALDSTSADTYYLDHGYTDDSRMQLFAADGEGYDLSVECRPGGCHDPAWEARPEPYYVSRRRAREAGMDE